ncbi:fimbria/pilus outer membrane usher protein [Piscinibacter sp.]|uniref:fimbria/pilus outer membrane usher protein n=1 Tax=Piscinibacter sp. TaxID=1903157 RepID=UPI002CFFC7FB|nr:fimbria/pilus outer membrane usher protein [Albitalea sp.]HUG24711.1 fimbria/pilus outer membrane usher protein [Albitalea sp.]
MRSWARAVSLGLVLLAAAGNPALGWAKAGSAEPPAADEDRLLALDVTVNGAGAGMWPLLRRAGGLYAPAEAFEQWRLAHVPATGAVARRGDMYWPLSSVQGFGYEMDEATQSVRLHFLPEAFVPTRVAAASAPAAKLSPVEPSLFVNYDASLAAARYRNAASTREFGLLSEIGVSTALGVLTSTHVLRSALDDQDLRTATRLDTTFVRHSPAARRLLKLGDAVTPVAMLAGGIGFAGVQWGTDDALRPGRSSQPMPLLSGYAVAPSTVELWVNDVLRQVSTVPTGPFTLETQGQPAGASDARVVVRDALGRQTVLDLPLFSHPDLLSAGRAQWSLSAGALRRGFGEASWDYGESFVSGRWRQGMSDRHTVELGGHGARDGASLQAGLSSELPFQALGTVALAASRHMSVGAGAAWSLGVQGGAGRQVYALQAEGATASYRGLGYEIQAAPSRLQASANWSMSQLPVGTLTLGASRILGHDSRQLSAISAGLSARVGNRAVLNLTLLRASGSASGSSLGVHLLVPLDGGLSVSAGSSTRSGRTDAHVAVTSPPAADSRWGWRALAGRRAGRPHSELGAYLQAEAGVGSLDLSSSALQTTARLGWQGGMLLVGGHAFATRRLEQSFAIVEVPGHAGLDIRLAGSPSARTDADGVALLPRVLPFQDSRVRLDANSLPLSAEIESIEQVAAAPWRSGVRVVFPVRGGRGALLRVVLDDGLAVPAGATVERIVEGRSEGVVFYTARRGEVFVTGMQRSERLRLTWRAQSCEFTVELPPAADDDISRVGPVACEGVAR